MKTVSLLIIALSTVSLGSAQQYTISTFATPTLGDADGIALDSGGNLYIADTDNCVIRKITPSGAASIVAGVIGDCGYNADAVPATSAWLDEPVFVAVDGSGNVYISDYGNYRIRKVTASTGLISTLAGDGTDNYSGDGGLAVDAELEYMGGIAVDASGNVYISDYDYGVVRVISASTGDINPYAGIPASFGDTGDGGPATSATLDGPWGIKLDSSGNLYIADYSACLIRKVTASTGNISTVAGNYTAGCGYSGDGGLATNAQLSEVYGVAADGSGNVFIADTYNSVVRMVSPSGIITTVAGNGTYGYSGDGGAATSAELSEPTDIAVNSSGAVYVADSYDNNVIRLLNPGAPPAEVIISSIVVNNASYTGVVAPGSIATVFGSFPLPWTITDTALPLQPSVDGLSFQINAVNAPIVWGNPAQVNFQIPWQSAGLTLATLTAGVSGQASASELVRVAAYAPGIFTVSAFQGSILDSNGKLVDAGNPATHGVSVVHIYGTGLGPVSNTPATGAPGPSSPLAVTTTTPTVTIGGAAATVQNSALAPGLVGIYQVDVLVPAGSATGNSVPVVLTIGGVTSNQVTMAVQ